MIEISYMVTEQVENKDVATKLDAIDADATKEFVRVKKVVTK